MRFVSPRFHGLVDYATAGAMIALPRKLGFSQSTTNLMTGAGAAIIGMSLMTRYPAGLIRILPMQVHLLADVALNALLIREGNNLSKKEPEAANAILGMAAAGTLVTLLTSPKQE